MIRRSWFIFKGTRHWIWRDEAGRIAAWGWKEPWMWRQTVCLRLQIKNKKYYSFRFSQYVRDREDLLSEEDFMKKAWKYFGKQIGKFSGTGRTYDEGDVTGSWRKYDLDRSEVGIESAVKMMFEKGAIGFEEHTS